MGSALFQGVVGTAVCSTRGRAGGVALLVEKLSQDLRTYCEEDVNAVDISKCLLPVTVAKAVIQ